jgi:hypothetical protein
MRLTFNRFPVSGFGLEIRQPETGNGKPETIF